MKKSFLRGIVVAFLAVLWAVGLAAAGQAQAGMSDKEFEKLHKADMQAHKEGRIFVMSGKITAIDLPSQNVMIECPTGGQIFTVGGPLSPNAVLKIGGKSVRLDDFGLGTSVTVKWKSTENGPVILMLKAK
jgi:hypothetical protein